jgi:hypothetical protein
MSNEFYRRNTLFEDLLRAEEELPPQVFTPRRPQLVSLDGQTVWAGKDIEVILSPGDPNWRPDRGIIGFKRAWR